ncbi:MAG: peptidoglycan DD-metalloendopeptidase family protein [Polyangiaceae bacterium]
MTVYGCAPAVAEPPQAPQCPSCEAAAAPTAPPSAPASKLALPANVASFEQLLERLEKRECDAIFASFNHTMQKALGADKTTQICTDLSKAAPFTQFVLTKQSGASAEFLVTHKGDGKLEASLTLDEAGKIAGLWFRPPAPPPAPVKKTTTALRLPFEGEWMVVWGGDNLADNKHITHKNQQRAADLIVMDETGKSHAGDGKQNKDYFAYGKKVLAAGDGVVVTVVDGVPDNPPGVMNQYAAVGNAVVLKHSDTEFSVYAHLQPGSIRVKPKMRVKAGQLLGLCGNSGNTSEPHIHFHLQDRADLATGMGLEPVFVRVKLEREGTAPSKKSEGTDAEAYLFKKGDHIAPR